jgi:glycosyltransferase involved in cell wall biosynthesis
MSVEIDENGHGERHRYVHYLRQVRLQEGGVVRAVLDICSSLAARGHEVTLLTCDGRDVPSAWKKRGGMVPQAVTIPVPRLLGGMPIEAEMILRDAQVLHLHTPWELSNLSFAQRANQLNVPYIVSIHGMLDHWSLGQKWLKKQLFLALIGRRFLGGAARVHCTAAEELSQVAPYLRSDSGIVMPYPVDLSPYLDLPGAKLSLGQYPEIVGDAPSVLFLSRLHPKKRPDLLIEAIAKLEKEGKVCQLILAGPGEPAYVSKLRQLAKERGLTRPMVFTGMVQGPLKASLFQAADVFVLPTSQENFGIVLVEALACGTPVITTRGVDIWKELQSGGAIIVDQDPAVIAAEIGALIADLPKAKQLGHQGREWVFREFDSNRVIGDYERMYQDVCQDRSGTGQHLSESGD